MMKEKMKKRWKGNIFGKNTEPFRKPDNFFLPFFAWLC